MPYFTIIRCPTNHNVLASFNNWQAYHYRLDDVIRSYQLERCVRMVSSLRTFRRMRTLVPS